MNGMDLSVNSLLMKSYHDVFLKHNQFSSIGHFVVCNTVTVGTNYLHTVYKTPTISLKLDDYMH